MKNEIVLRPAYWASVSGGKDSYYMLGVIFSNLDKYPLNGIVHYELEIDYPFIADVINAMETAAKSHNIPFVRIRPRKSWYDLYQKYGYPSRRARWCNNVYKLDAQRQLKEYLKTRGLRVVNYIGICADETKRLKQKPDTIYPLAQEGIEEETILQWARNNPIFNNFYRFNRRCGCMGCPMQSLRESAYTKKYYPEEYAKIYEFARNHEIEKNISVWSGNKKYNTEYRDMIIKRKYLPQLNLEIMKGGIEKCAQSTITNPKARGENGGSIIVICSANYRK